MNSERELAHLSDESLAELNTCLPPYWSKGNPLDVLGDADNERYLKAINICLNDPGVDGILIIYTPQGATKPHELAKTVVEISKNAWKPILTAWIGGDDIQKARKNLIQNGIPTYETPEDAVKTYLYMYKYFRNLKLLYETPVELSTDLSPAKHNLKALIKRAITEGRKVLTEEESKRFLINYGIPTTKPYLSRDVEDAVCMAGRIGYPVVLKITSPDITHKSDIGGVLTGIHSDEGLRAGYNSLIKKVKENVPEARMVGVSIQKMILDVDYELILGVKKDKDFGSVILFGMGGVDVEMFRDISIGLPPLNQTLAKRLMEETKVYQMLKGFRGRTPADMRQLEQILVNFSDLIVDFPEIAEMDINPLAVSNGKPYALDARIILDSDALKYTVQFPHLVITPYPTRYIIPWKLSDGTEVTLRPIRPEDEPLEHEMLTTLSKEALNREILSGNQGYNT